MFSRSKGVIFLLAWAFVGVIHFLSDPTSLQTPPTPPPTPERIDRLTSMVNWWYDPLTLDTLFDTMQTLSDGQSSWSQPVRYAPDVQVVPPIGVPVRPRLGEGETYVLGWDVFPTESPTMREYGVVKRGQGFAVYAVTKPVPNLSGRSFPSYRIGRNLMGWEAESPWRIYR